MRRHAAIAVTLLLASCQSAPPKAPPVPPVGATVTIGGKALKTEWVHEGLDREVLLRKHAPLGPDESILIGYGRERTMHHHCEGGRADYNVAWLSKDRRVVETAKLPADAEVGVTSSKDAQYALFTAPGRGPAVGETAAFSAEIARSPAVGPPTITIGAVPFHAEISSTIDQRCRGLMHRRRMSADDGMLFVYRDERDLSFWMGDCHYTLDIAFFDANAKLLNVVTIDPYPDPKVDTGARAKSEGKARFVVEANAGWFRAHKVEPGAPLVMPSDVAAAAAEAE